MRAVVETHSEEETRRLGMELAAVVEPGDILLLSGPFGAGKTTLVQGIARGLHIGEAVTSPSFVIASEYQGRIPLYHVDLYRVERLDATTLEALAEYFGGDGVCAVEWPNGLPADLTEGATRIELSVTGRESRLLAVEAPVERLAQVFRVR